MEVAEGEEEETEDDAEGDEVPKNRNAEGEEDEDAEAEGDEEEPEAEDEEEEPSATRRLLNRRAASPRPKRPKNPAFALAATPRASAWGVQGDTPAAGKGANPLPAWRTNLP